jgi:hypothetical protein
MDQPLTGPIVHQLKSRPRKVKAQEHLKPRASETRSLIRDQGLEFESEISEFETFEISKSETFEISESETSGKFTLGALD